MPGYGLPKGTKGLLAWSWAERRLEKSHNYWITTVRADRAPHTMIVWGLWMDGVFLFSTGRLSRKARNLAKNRHCVVCTEQADHAVIVEGIADLAFVEDSNGKTIWNIVDFKTDLAIASRLEEYRAQISLYTRGIARASNLPTRGILFWI